MAICDMNPEKDLPILTIVGHLEDFMVAAAVAIVVICEIHVDAIVIEAVVGSSNSVTVVVGVILVIVIIVLLVIEIMVTVVAVDVLNPRTAIDDDLMLEIFVKVGFK